MDLSILDLAPPPKIVHTEKSRQRKPHKEQSYDRLARSRSRLANLPHTFRLIDLEGSARISKTAAWFQCKTWLDQGAITRGEKYRDQFGIYQFTYIKTGRLPGIRAYNYMSTCRVAYLSTKTARARERYVRMLEALPDKFTTVDARDLWGMRPNGSLARETLGNMAKAGLVRMGGRLAHKHNTRIWRKV